MTIRFRAPGRVNLIGEHTDYNDGFVLPAAIHLETTATAVPSSSFEYSSDDAGPGWERYVEGVLQQIRRLGIEPPPVSIHFQSTLPLGAGLSSSAALEVSAALTLLAAAEVDLDRMDIARLCQQTEVETIGLECGLMDPFISLFGEAGHAMLLDCRSLEYRKVPIPAGISLVIADTGVKHSLAGSEYNQRRAECQQAAQELGVSSLRDATRDGGSRRARHVISENARTLAFADALERDDRQAMGELMAASHRSLRDDYEVSCQELDRMVEVAAMCPGFIGARMTGGGFGGSTINLVEEGQASDFVARLKELYGPAEIRITRASDGARRSQ